MTQQSKQPASSQTIDADPNFMLLKSDLRTIVIRAETIIKQMENPQCKPADLRVHVDQLKSTANTTAKILIQLIKETKQ